MSGHSKWATIKRKKGALDAKRGKAFTRLAKEITIAARDGAGDPEMNPRLRTAITNARAQNMPKDNIERALKKGTGEIEGVSYEEISYEGYGPAGVAILVRAVTDNTNRTIAEVRHAFSKYGGSLAKTGAVSYLFEQKGIFLVSEEVADEEKLMDVVLDAGAEDVAAEDGMVTITAPLASFHAVSQALEEAGIDPESSELEDVPSLHITVSAEDAPSLLKLIGVLDDLDDTSKVSSNFDLDEETLARLQDEL